MPFILIAFIGVVVIISVIPDYKDSKRPFNKLVAFASSEGFALGVLMPDASMVTKAAEEVEKTESIIQRSIPTKFLSGADAESIAHEQGVSIPGYILLDGDGNVAVRENDVLKSDVLSKYFANLHTH